MNPATVRMPVEAPRRRVGARARYRFAAVGVALALAVGLGTPALAGAIASAWHLPVESVVVSVGALVALVFLVAGWALGRRIDRLSDEARRDPVTKVGNRRHWEECLSHEVERAIKAKMPLSLLMVDVDHLKKLNDAGGHGAGDRALSIVGSILNETCRSRDVAARFGGDEFAILLPVRAPPKLGWSQSASELRSQSADARMAFRSIASLRSRSEFAISRPSN